MSSNDNKKTSSDSICTKVAIQTMASRVSENTATGTPLLKRVRVSTAKLPLEPLEHERLSVEERALYAQLIAMMVEHRGNVTRVGEAMGKARTQVQRWARPFRIDARSFRR